MINLTVGFENIITLAVILSQPNDTRTRHLLCLIFEINIFSAKVKFCNTDGIEPIQKKLARDSGGFLFFFKKL
jgi:hypothetical protein